MLRQVPSFSLFRRTSSLAAQPTAQGVSLRGIGPSGQSRTLVLLDGMPFNDPFGGWVYWTRVPLESVDRVEITEDCLVEPLRQHRDGRRDQHHHQPSDAPHRRSEAAVRQPQQPEVRLLRQRSVEQGRRRRVEGSFLHTDGFPIVAAIERGPIDNNANVDYKNFTGKLEYTPNDRFQAFARAGYFSEDRNNAKVGEVNDTRWTTINGGIRAHLPDDSDLQARLFGDIQRAHFNFLAVTNAATHPQHRPPGDRSERADRRRRRHGAVVEGASGGATPSARGFDFRWVDGESQEAAYVASVPTVITPFPGGCPPGLACGTQAATLSVQRFSGGSQQSLGAFVQDIFTPIDKLVLTLSARVDRWNNYNGHNLETTVATGLPTANNRPSIPDSNDTVVSPHLGALYHASDRVSLWGAANSGFRAPTLTELYRQFSVGAITTRPNDQLAPERLVGGEAGHQRRTGEERVGPPHLVRQPDRRTRSLNVTLNATTAQKQNLPETRVNGCPDRRRLPHRHGVALLGRLYLRRCEGDRRRDGERGAGRQGPAAGAEAPRLVPGRVCEPEDRDGRAQRAVRRPAVQRRPERELHSGADTGRRRLRRVRTRRGCRATPPST